jgi:hypothetical protein
VISTARSRAVLLWNAPSTVAVCAIAIAITIAIVAFQDHERRGLLDPTNATLFYRLFLFIDYPGSFVVLATLIAGLLIPLQGVGAAVADFAGHHVSVFAGVVLASLAAGAYWIFRTPFSVSEYAAYLQGQVFAAGQAYGRYPAELIDWLLTPELQRSWIAVSRDTGEFASKTGPSSAASFAPFAFAGFAWLRNPVLAVVTLVMIHRLTATLVGSNREGGIAMLLMVASPVFVLNAISFDDVAAQALCNATFALLLIEPTPRRAGIAGLVGAIGLTLQDPMSHVLFASPWLAWLLWSRDRITCFPLLLIGYLPGIAVAIEWREITGALQSAAASTGLPPTSVAPIGWRDWLDAEFVETRAINLMKLWLWSAPALVLVATVGFWRHRIHAGVRLLVASLLLVLVGKACCAGVAGYGWGYRDLQAAWFVLPVFAAAAAAQAGVTIGRVNADGLGRFAVGAAVASLLLLLPFYLWQVNSYVLEQRAQLPTSSRGETRLVIVNPYAGYYSEDLVQNDPFLRDAVVRMLSQGRRRDEAMVARRYPDLVLLSRRYRGSVWGESADSDR